MENAKQHYPARLKAVYDDRIVDELMEKFQYSSRMAVPRLVKVTLNMGLGEVVSDRKVVDSAMGDLEKIAGQKPVMTRARKSIAGFKIREGWPIGCKVTLRRARMYEFIDRFVAVTLPRIRDFRGINPRAFDGQGNYSIGLKEQIVFPEIDYDRVDTLRGLDVVITTSAKTDEEGRALLESFNFPFRR